MQIEYMFTNDLIGYARNARRHSVKQVAQISASILEFGFLNPILIDKKNTIIAGHGRLAAAQQLALEKVPVIRAEHLTEAQRKAYTLLDNQIASNSDWDNDILKIEIEELKSLDFNIDLLGFDSLDFSADLPDEDDKKNIDPKLSLTVSFENQTDQEDLFSELMERGFKVKI